RVGGVEELVAPERDADVVDVPARVAEEDEIAGHEVLAVDGDAVRCLDLLVGDAGNANADLRVGPLDQPRTVEAGARRRSSPPVRRADVLLGLGERGERTRAGDGLCVAVDGVGEGAAARRAFGPGEELARVVELRLIPRSVLVCRPLHV